jgi:hypothetical protein
VPLRLATRGRRALNFGLLIFLSVIWQSCGGGPSSGYLASHSEGLVNRTVPGDASNFKRNEVKETQWSETSSWEFDAKPDRSQYVEWVTNNLKGEFKVVKSSGDSMVFAKNLDGDTETIVLALKPDNEFLHVRVVVSVAPD